MAVDIARALYNCVQKPGRKLMQLDNYKETFNKENNLGEAFEVIKKLTKDEDERILCAYQYSA